MKTGYNRGVRELSEGGGGNGKKDGQRNEVVSNMRANWSCKDGEQ